MNNELKSLLDKDTWHAYREQSTLYADRRLCEVLAAPKGAEPLLDGMRGADFVCQAMMDVVDGVKPWDPETCPKLRTFLLRTVRDLIRNAVRRHDTTHTTHVGDEDAFGDESSPSPVDEVEARLFVEGFVRYLEAEGDEDMILITYCFAEGLGRADVAVELGLTPDDVTNMRKRLGRRMTAYKAQTRTINSA